MISGFYLKDGIASLWVQGWEDNRAALREAAMALAADEREPAWKRAIAAKRANLLSAPLDLGQFVVADREDWPELVIGEAPVWPRQLRNRLLMLTDYVDIPGWRAGKSADLLAAADLKRSMLRDMPDQTVDPLTAFSALKGWAAQP